MCSKQTLRMLRVCEQAVPQVTDYTWGTEVAGLGEPPDLITGADIVYQQEHFPALVQTLDTLAAGHTLIYLAFRLRGVAKLILSHFFVTVVGQG
jgi:hypothetical protein